MNRHAEVLRHPAWCANDHRCSLGEHRAVPVVVEVAGVGRVVLTRVLGANGRQHAEIRLTVALQAAEPVARLQLAALTHELVTLLRRAALRAARIRRAAS